MDLIGKRVKHNKFGEGVITQQDTSRVSVRFVTEVELKKFEYYFRFSVCSFCKLEWDGKELCK